LVRPKYNKLLLSFDAAQEKFIGPQKTPRSKGPTKTPRYLRGPQKKKTRARAAEKKNPRNKGPQKNPILGFLRAALYIRAKILFARSKVFLAKSAMGD